MFVPRAEAYMSASGEDLCGLGEDIVPDVCLVTCFDLARDCVCYIGEHTSGGPRSSRSE